MSDVMVDLRRVQCPACSMRFIVDRALAATERCPREGCDQVVDVDACTVNGPALTSKVTARERPNRTRRRAP